MALPDSLPATRQAWHQVAEHVLAAARCAMRGHIGLVPARRGSPAAPTNSGVSPAHAPTAQPDLYVSPSARPPPVGDASWTAPFGAVPPYPQVTSMQAAVEFYHTGHARAHALRASTQPRSRS